MFFLHRTNNCLSFLNVLNVNACVIVLFMFSHVENSSQCNVFFLIKKKRTDQNEYPMCHSCHSNKNNKPVSHRNNFKGK